MKIYAIFLIALVAATHANLLEEAEFDLESAFDELKDEITREFNRDVEQRGIGNWFKKAGQAIVDGVKKCIGSATCKKIVTTGLGALGKRDLRDSIKKAIALARACAKSQKCIDLVKSGVSAALACAKSPKCKAFLTKGVGKRDKETRAVVTGLVTGAVTGAKLCAASTTCSGLVGKGIDWVKDTLGGWLKGKRGLRDWFRKAGQAIVDGVKKCVKSTTCKQIVKKGVELGVGAVGKRGFGDWFKKVVDVVKKGVTACAQSDLCKGVVKKGVALGVGAAGKREISGIFEKIRNTLDEALQIVDSCTANEACNTLARDIIRFAVEKADLKGMEEQSLKDIQELFTNL